MRVFDAIVAANLAEIDKAAAQYERRREANGRILGDIYIDAIRTDFEITDSIMGH